MSLLKPSQVAKVVLIDNNGHYLLLQRNDHPDFGFDPDLPGGTLEDGEASLQTLLREVVEEIGVILRPEDVTHHFTGSKYSKHGTIYHLYSTRVHVRPEITISWEHASHEWIHPEIFLAKSRNAKDTYMHMVHDVMSQQHMP